MSRLASLLSLLPIAALASACDPSSSYDPPDFNSRPFAASDSLTVDENGTGEIDVLANDTDFDGDWLQVVSVRAPTGHSARVVGRNVVVTPATAYTGSFEVSYTVSDGALTATGTISVYVQPVWRNTTPTAYGVSLTLEQDTPTTVTLSAYDVESDPLTFTIVTWPSAGTLSGTTPYVTYTPNPGFYGTDGFSFTASDGSSTSVAQWVSLSVTQAPAVPVPQSATVTLGEDASKEIVLTIWDPGRTAYQYSYRYTQPRSGQVNVYDAYAYYTPSSNFAGSDSFTFWLEDWRGNKTSVATISLVVEPVDDAPVATARSLRLLEDATTPVQLAGSDVDSTELTFAVRRQPSRGTLVGTSPTLEYRPAPNYAGTDSFTYVAIANGVESAPATVSLQVDAVNDSPSALAGSFVTAEDTAVAVVLGAVDIDTTALTYTIVTGPTKGTMSGTGNQLRYTPNPNVSGSDQLTFQVSDGTSTSRAPVSLTITPVNDAPRTRDDVAVTGSGQAVVIAAADNDADIEGDAFAVSETSTPAHGTATLDDAGDVVYTPAADFTGTETFTYTVSDADGATATATIRVGVGGFPVGVPLEAVGSTDDSVHVPSLSRDGRFVAFASNARLVSDDSDDVVDIYVFDRALGTYLRVSKALTGTRLSAPARSPHISADGSRIVYTSAATNIVAGDQNGTNDVFLFDRTTGISQRISVAVGGGDADGTSTNPVISADGNVVAFVSNAFNLVDSDTNGVYDVFVRDLTAATTVRASVSASGREADTGSSTFALSGDGKVVAFTSTATNLVPGDTNALADVFVRVLAERTTERVSVASSGTQATGASIAPSLSFDGRFVGFLSMATDLVPDTTGATNRAYVRDRREGTTIAVVPGVNTAVTALTLSADGRYAVLQSNTGVIGLRNRFAARSSNLVAAGANSRPVISADGSYIAFTSGLLLVPGTPSAINVFVLPRVN